MKRSQPPIYSADLPRAAADLAGQLEEIEALALRGALSVIRPQANYSTRIDRRFWECLSWPEKAFEAGVCPKREEWITACLDKFRAHLREPDLRFPAKPGRARDEVECIGPDGPLYLRFDQVAFQRRWGIEIFSEDQALDQRLADYCLGSALGRLISDWESVNHFCWQWGAHSSRLQGISFTHHQSGNRFEQLVLGILNEQRVMAKSASLCRDVWRWTDMEVRPPGERYYFRLQSKFYRTLEDHDAEIANRAEDTIVVSPVEIARFLERNGAREEGWQDLLEMFPRRIGDLQELATEIYSLFFESIKRQVQNPFDPIAGIPRILRQAMRAMVISRARALSESLRRMLASAEPRVLKLNVRTATA